MSEESIEKVLYGKSARFHSSPAGTPRVKIVVDTKKDNDSNVDPEDLDLSDLDLTLGEHDDQDLDIEFITRIWGEDDDKEGFMFYQPGEEESEAEMSLFAQEVDEEEEEEEEEPSKEEDDSLRKKSIFIFSFPTHFPDIVYSRKSAFASIFLKTSSRLADDLALLKSITECNFTLLQSLLSAFEEILMTKDVDADKRKMALLYRNLIVKSVELTKLGKISPDGSIHWDMYPITQSHLFTILVGQNAHYTRRVGRAEDRFVQGLMQTLKFPHGWPTNSIYTGHWDTLGMAGPGTYIMPHGVTYQGKFKDGMFHDEDATLTYPNKFKALHCVYKRGKLLSCQFQFPDGLLHSEENWDFCKFPDRRFYSEVRNGVKAAKIAQKTEINPPRKIPTGCYDTNDGFYYPQTLTLLSPTGELLRVPVFQEDYYIRKYYRKGFFESADFRPEYYENWFTKEQINIVLKSQESYRRGKIGSDDLQQIYADNNLLPPWSKYKKRKSPLEIAHEEYQKTLPEPLVLKLPRRVKKYRGHKWPSRFRVTPDVMETDRKIRGLPRPLLVPNKKSKSLLRFHDHLKPKPSQEGTTTVNTKTSRISFKISSDRIEPLIKDHSKTISESSSTSSVVIKKKIPERYLKPTPIIRPPFVVSIDREKPLENKPKCIEKEDSDVTESGASTRRVSAPVMLEKYMKTLILDAITKGLVDERERHRKRVLWAQPISIKHSKKESKNSKCMAILKDLFKSIPDREEYTSSPEDSIMGKCNLKKLAEDKYNTLMYWGKRLFILDFGERNNSF